jgi:hypothetical protein
VIVSKKAVSFPPKEKYTWKSNRLYPDKSPSPPTIPYKEGMNIYFTRMSTPYIVSSSHHSPSSYISCYSINCKLKILNSNPNQPPRKKKKKKGKSAMEIELGLKITHTRDDLTSTADFRIAKDQAGPIFMSRENDTMFILTAHLKGQFLSLSLSLSLSL